MESEDDAQLSSFKHAAVFDADACTLLGLDLDAQPTKQEEAQEVKLVGRLGSILDEYQEQSYLLDPYLEHLVKPIIAAFRARVRLPHASLTTPRTRRLSHLIYFFTKVRGAKTIVRLFPHEVDDLAVLLELFEDPEALQVVSWETRYILLLWLSLVCMLPFALHLLDGSAAPSSSTRPTSKIESIGKRYLGSSSKERDGAVALLARYYSRQDTSVLTFVAYCEEYIAEGSPDILMSAGILQTLCEIVKVASPVSILAASSHFQSLLASCESIKATGGGLFAKYRVKLAGRLAVLRLTSDVNDGEAGEALEAVIQEMLEGLENEDTIVRWSASKYLARIAERLPESSSHEIVEALLGTFDEADEIHPSENAWQGACLALAELARRDRIPEELVGPLLDCVLRALLFDRKRGVQSIGAGVRDAAAYVLWSLARTLRSSQVEPHSTPLAVHLVAVSLFDREIQIRRAASAAFQESVGRWGVFPHGIDVLRTVDFLTVSVRKRAFLEAAPAVASHVEYREALVKHLITVSVVHYDPEIRTLAASSLELIVRLDPEHLLPPLLASQISALATKDTSKLHGALLSLAALASASEGLPDRSCASMKTEIFRSLTNTGLATLSSHASSLLLPAALLAIEKSSTVDSLFPHSGWWPLIQLACKQPQEESPRRAADAMRRISSLVDCSSRAPIQQQNAALILGCVDFFSENRHRLLVVVQRLITFSGNDVTLRAKSIEGKRNGVEALAAILTAQSALDPLGPDIFASALDTIFEGFADYTVDQRGDVGSWVRLASIAAVEHTFAAFARGSSPLLQLSLFNQDRLDIAVASLLKQAVERLDKLREAAGQALERMFRLEVARSTAEQPILRAPALFASLQDHREHSEWRSLAWASARVLPFLSVPQYRPSLLEGAVLGITPHGSSSPFLDYATTLPPCSSSAYSLLQLCCDLSSLAKRNFARNRVFVPCMTAVGMLTEAGVPEELNASAEGEQSLRQVLALATRSIEKIKSGPRLTATVKIVVNLLAIPATASLAAEKVGVLLAHSLPWVRQHAAEELYDRGTVQEDELGEELQTLLLETPWTDGSEYEAAAQRVASLLVTQANPA